MFKQFMLIAILMSISFGQSCHTTQYWSVVTSPDSIFQSTSITTVLDKSVSLQGIHFNILDEKFLIDDISAIPVYTNVVYSLMTDKLVQLTIPLSFYIKFHVVDLNSKLSVVVGTGRIQAENLVIRLQKLDKLVPIWTVQNITLIDTYHPVIEISISDPKFYSAVAYALNSGGSGKFSTALSSQITDYFNGNTFRQTIISQIQSDLDILYGQTYTYTYRNINGIQLPVKYNVTVLNSVLTDSTLSVERVMSIIGYQNLCEQDMPHPNTRYDDRFAYQVTAISFPQIFTTFRYALENKYFDTKLNQLWNSPMFQFNVGSLQNVLKGLRGNFLARQQITGQCTAIALTANLKLGPGNLLTAQIPYQCQIFPVGSVQESMASAHFTLDLELEIITNVTELLVQARTAIVQTLIISGSDNYELINPQLASLYIQSIVTDCFIGQNLFGSGFPTMNRNLLTASTISGQDLIIYQYNEQNQITQ